MDGVPSKLVNIDWYPSVTPILHDTYLRLRREDSHREENMSSCYTVSEGTRDGTGPPSPNGCKHFSPCAPCLRKDVFYGLIS